MTDRYRQPEWKKRRQEEALRQKFEDAYPMKKPKPKGTRRGWLAAAGLGLIAWAIWKAWRQ